MFGFFYFQAKTNKCFVIFHCSLFFTWHSGLLTSTTIAVVITVINVSVSVRLIVLIVVLLCVL